MWGQVTRSGSAPGMVAPAVLRFARERGLPIEPLIEGLAPEIEHQVRLGLSGSWDDIARLYERLDAADPRALEAYADYLLNRVPPVVFMLSHLMTVNGLYRFVFFVWGRCWPTLGFRSARASGGWILRARIDRRYRGCEPFMRLVTLVLERLPRVQGRPLAKVEARITDGWRAEWHISELENASEDDLDPEELYDNVRLAAFGGPERRPRIPPAWQLTPAERRVVERVVAGASVAEIARVLSVGRETVRTHLKRAMFKAGVRRQAELVARVYAHRDS